MQDPDCSLKCFASLVRSLPSGFSRRTSLALSPLGVPSNRRLARWKVKNGKWKRQAILKPSLLVLSGSGLAWPGGLLTLSSSEFPKDATVSLLSDVLETQGVPAKYCLSPKACRGILRRAAKRGRTLPEELRLALERVAATLPPCHPERWWEQRGFPHGTGGALCGVPGEWVRLGTSRTHDGSGQR